ncbi:VCBS repeat-containing protein [Sphingomonas sabuli]|uniref:VCBS repeat-containing protein n=1 Tax=Sphingomonas sabuli TaxID=2764186 RepID=A0A7G9L2Z4_9SPHN|nr:FG-GAP-like repeat-containing protein [Sphingomonas sabuli]QNM82993.1 VCBS repeat-containing protein [Sphingomonas sabuli]
MPAPTLTNLSGEVIFSRPVVTTVPQIIDGDVTFNDPDDDFDGATVILSTAGLALAEDQFGIRNEGIGAGRINTIGSNVTYGGVTIGTFEGGVDGQPLTITLNANATSPAVEALIENLTYAHTSATPTAERFLSINVLDAAGNDLNGGFTGAGFTLLEGSDNPFNNLGSQQVSYEVTPTLYDYDGDGDLDIFCGAADGEIHLLRNDGPMNYVQVEGAGNPFGTINTNVSDGELTSIAFLDLDGDNDKDAVILDGQSGIARRYTNNGNGTFSDAGALFDRGYNQHGRMATYDYDNDGDLDLVVGGRDGLMFLYQNNLNNTVTKIDTHPFNVVQLPVGSYPAPTFADIDGDGDLDMVHGNSNGHFIFYRNSNGIFTQEDTFEAPFWSLRTGQNSAPVFDDIDGDGDLDMIAGVTNLSLQGRIEVYRNDGVGWGMTVRVAVDPSAFWNGTPDSDTFAAFTGDNWTIRGLDSDDNLSGSTGNDIINGGTGNDQMTGGAGNDTYVVDSAGDVVVENTGQGIDTVRSSVTHVLAANVERLTLTGTANINATGNALNNLILGNSGNNVINGGAGADIMRGGAGDDSYFASQFGDRAVEANNSGNDTVRSSINFRLANYVETLILTGSDNLEGIGSAQANTIIGNSGNNFIHGAGGADMMSGGAGNDIYVVENAGDQVVESAGEGRDIVYSSVSFTLGANVEDLTLSSNGAVSGTGNNLANSMLGNAAANLLSGLGGNDEIIGGGGNDQLRGGAGADNLNGGNGDDKVDGGVGMDIMSGGTGSDMFIFRDGDFGGATPVTADRIRDFSHGEIDRMDFSLVDANANVAGDQGFQFIGKAAFSAAGQLRFEQIGANTYVFGDTNGDGVADFAVRVDGLQNFVIGDFIL